MIPNSFKSWFKRRMDSVSMVREHLIDARRFERYSGVPDSAVPNSLRSRRLETQVIKDYHRVEKGLALGAPKRPFGATVAARLDRFVPEAESSEDPRLQEAAVYGKSARAALSRWNEEGARDSDVAPELQLRDISAEFDADGFFSSRHSIREFDQHRHVDDDTIWRAVRHFQRTPSVCNRQAARVHFYDDPAQIRALLKIQAGSAGFADAVSQLAVLTVQDELFTGAGERNQHWIDGSLAAMTLVWSFHALGVATCMLNWSKRNIHSKRLREVGQIPANESVICLLAFGYPAEKGVRHARSPRRPLTDVATMHRKR